MQLSWKVILGPLVGALAGWLTSKIGMPVSPDVLMAGGATLFTWIGHVWNEWEQSKAAPITPVVPTNPAPPKQSGRTSIAPLFVIAALALAACSMLGITQPTTFNEKLALGYGTATAVLTSTDTLLKAGKITSSVASNIESQDANLKAALDIAQATYASNQTDGGNQLATALTALNALSSYLATLH